MSAPTSPATPEATDKLTYWQERLASATDRFERNRAERMVESIERQAARARGERVEVPKRRNYGFGHWSRRAR